MAKRNGKAKWQSEMAKAECGAKRTSRFRTAPAVSGKVYENYENSDVGVCEGSGLINN
jgi:hypothetical protein